MIFGLYQNVHVSIYKPHLVLISIFSISHWHSFFYGVCGQYLVGTQIQMGLILETDHENMSEDSFDPE